METLLALGSNVGDRLGFLSRAVGLLGDVLADMRLSRIYESVALLPEGASADMDMPYLNMAIAGRTGLEPQMLLAKVKQFERDMGRIHRAVWGPREIDIDVVAMGDTVISSESLSLPHPEMLKRDFVMLPMLDVAPGWVHPLAGKTVRDICREHGYGTGESLKDSGLVVHGY